MTAPGTRAGFNLSSLSMTTLTPAAPSRNTATRLRMVRRDHGGLNRALVALEVQDVPTSVQTQDILGEASHRSARGERVDGWESCRPGRPASHA